jgi:ABC-2 type transport system permease protein
MLRQVFAKEYAELRQDPRLRWSLMIVYALFAVALFTGYRYYSQTHRQHTEAQQASYEQWLDQGQKNPHSAAHYGFYAYKPVPLLSVIDKGMDDYLGNAVWMEAHKQNEVRERAAQDAVDLGRFGTLTVGFLWQYILPLVIILLTFNAVSKERESGTLRMLLATETSPRQLVLGKAWAVLQAVWLLFFLPMFAVSAAAMLAAGGGEAFVQNLPGLGLAFVFYTIFLALLTGIGVWVSAQVRQSGLALVALLGFWAFGAFFVPRIGSSFAKAAHPTPSAFAFSQQVEYEKSNGIDGHNPSDKFYKELEAKTLQEYGVDSLSQLPVSFAAISLQASENRDWVIFDKNYGALFDTFQRQNRFMDAFNALSPVLAMRNLSRALAGTDVDKHVDFTRHAEGFRRMMQQTLNGEMKTKAAGKDYDYMADETLWKKIPPFTYRPPGVGAVLKNQWLNLSVLLVWTVGVWVLLGWTARRLRP